MKKNKILNYLLIILLILLVVYCMFNNNNLIENIDNSSKCEKLEKENEEQKKEINDQNGKYFCDNIKLKFEELNKKVLKLNKVIQTKTTNANNSLIKPGTTKISVS